MTDNQITFRMMLAHVASGWVSDPRIEGVLDDRDLDEIVKTAKKLTRAFHEEKNRIFSD